MEKVASENFDPALEILTENFLAEKIPITEFGSIELREQSDLRGHKSW